MPGFVKPTRKVVNIEDAFGELIGKKLIKDLHDNEEICPVCHGTGLRIEDNPYGLSDDPDKRAGQFPYKHQSIQFCPNCYNGVVRFCPDCGKQIPRYRTLCDCDAVVQRRQQEENRKEKERLEKAEKHEPNALGSLFAMAQSDFYSHNEGYFSCWEDFFDSWNEDREEFTEKPLYVWGTEEVEMSFDASSIVSNACEDMLTVIKRVEDRKPGRPMWLCQCECGNTVVVSSTNLLRTNGTKSCGCLRHTSSPTLIDLRGKTFGKLKVIEKDPDSKPGKAKWVCECKCGNIVSVLSDSLRNGKTRSCGCARSQIKHDLTNQTFGFLKVIEPVKNERIKGNETRWKCLCQNCGRTVEVSSYWLRHSDSYGHCKCTRFNKPL